MDHPNQNQYDSNYNLQKGNKRGGGRKNVPPENIQQISNQNYGGVSSADDFSRDEEGNDDEVELKSEAQFIYFDEKNQKQKQQKNRNEPSDDYQNE